MKRARSERNEKRLDFKYKSKDVKKNSTSNTSRLSFKVTFAKKRLKQI